MLMATVQHEQPEAMTVRVWGAVSKYATMDCASGFVAAGQGLNFPKPFFFLSRGIRQASASEGHSGGLAGCATQFLSQSKVVMEDPSDPTGLRLVHRRDGKNHVLQSLYEEEDPFHA